MKLQMLFKKILTDRSGATAVEYGLIVALIAIVIFASVSTVGSQTGGLWATVQQKVASVM